MEMRSFGTSHFPMKKFEYSRGGFGVARWTDEPNGLEDLDCFVDCEGPGRAAWGNEIWTGQAMVCDWPHGQSRDAGVLWTPGRFRASIGRCPCKHKRHRC